MKIELTELLVITQEEHGLLTEAQNLVQRIYEDARSSGNLENIASQLEMALNDLLEFENLEVE